MKKNQGYVKYQKEHIMNCNRYQSMGGWGSARWSKKNGNMDNQSGKIE